MTHQSNSSPGILHKDGDTQARSMELYYRLHAQIYDATRWSFLFGRKGIINALPLPSDASLNVLEVGCGTGINLALLAKRFPNAQIIGLDVSDDMLAKATKQTRAYRERVTLVKEPYGAGSQVAQQPLDLILCSYSLTMINPQWQEVVQKAKEDLKPGGLLAAVDFHRSDFGWFERHMGNNHVRMDGHLLPFFHQHFDTLMEKTPKAYGGVWEYLMYIGKKA